MIWEYIKHEIKKFSISFSKQYAKNKRTEIFVLEKKLKQLEANANFNFDDHYFECKNNLEQIYGVKMELRSKVNAIRMDLVRDLQNFSLT